MNSNSSEQLLIQIVKSYQNFKYNQYCSSGSYEWAIVFTLGLGTLVFILSKIFDQFSWIDRVWSILPIGYAAHFLYYTKQCTNQKITLKQWIVFGFITIWGLRLTYNFYRKGGYSKIGPGSQDYRWQYIRKTQSKISVQILNFFFTSYLQIFLILWFTSPINVFKGQINYIDIGLFITWILLFLGQVIADNQQWHFQTKKYELLNQMKSKDITKLPQPYRKGFITSQLWKFSRHPNFFCQISMWWTIGAIGYNSIGFNYTIFGALFLNLLFLMSTRLTQKISCEKYSEYKNYQNSTSMLIPFFKFSSGKQRKINDKSN